MSPIGDYFQNSYTDPVAKAFGEKLTAFTFDELCIVAAIISRAQVSTRENEPSPLNMCEAELKLRDRLPGSSRLIKEAVMAIDGFPSNDAPELHRAFVDAIKATTRLLQP